MPSLLHALFLPGGRTSHESCADGYLLGLTGSLPGIYLAETFSRQDPSTQSIKEANMPQILVAADTPEETQGPVVYQERIALSDLESDHFAAQLVERVGWAVLDADEVEKKGAPSDS